MAPVPPQRRNASDENCYTGGVFEDPALLSNIYKPTSAPVCLTALHQSTQQHSRAKVHAPTPHSEHVSLQHMLEIIIFILLYLNHVIIPQLYAAIHSLSCHSLALLDAQAHSVQLLSSPIPTLGRTNRHYSQVTIDNLVVGSHDHHNSATLYALASVPQQQTSEEESKPTTALARRDRASHII
jgi:hypothetical protein